MRHVRRTLPTLAVLLLLASTTQAKRNTGPWDMTRLKTVPAATWGETVGLVREVYYEGEPLDGAATRVFAYYARPASGDGPFPGMILLHGGGGKAFSEWAELWAKRGYAALAMDFSGRGPDGNRLPDGGPEQGHPEKFADFTDADAEKMWTYHAVAAAVRGHSLLASLPEVDGRRIGVTGISWGGYLTCIVTGVDDRLKVSVPVYGCGFLHENSAWLPIFADMTPELRERWVKYWDPSRYLAGVSCPILFVNGTDDFAYPLDSHQKCRGLVPGRVDTRIQVAMPHGHGVGWAPKEIGLYVDSVLTGGQPLAQLGPLKTADSRVSATVVEGVTPLQGRLHYTTDPGGYAEGKWNVRQWTTVDAAIVDGVVRADLPDARPLVYYLSVTDARDAMTSTGHARLP